MLAQKLILSYSSKIIIQLIQVCVTIVVARVAGPSTLGTIAFALAFVNVFAFVSDLGVPTGYIKNINDGQDEAVCNGTFLCIQIILVALFFCTVFAWFGYHQFSGSTFEGREQEIVVILLAFSVTIQRFFQSIKTVFMAQVHQSKVDIPEIVYSFVFQLFRLTVVLLGYKAIAIAASNLVATVIMIPLYYYLIRQYPIGAFDKKMALVFFKTSVPMILILISQSILTNSDKIILQYYTSSEQVGYYTAGFRVGGFVQLIAVSIGAIFFPLFSKAIFNNQTELLNQYIYKFEKFMFSFVFPVVIIAVIYSENIVHILLGAQYSQTVAILSIITVALYIQTVFQPYGNVVLAKGWFYHSAFVHLFQVIFFVAMAFWFVNPEWLGLGGKGLAVVLLMTYLFNGIVFVYLSKKSLPALKILPAIKLMIYGLVVAGLFSHLKIHIGSNLIVNIGFGMSFFLFYWGCGWILGLIRMESWAMVLNFVKLNKMKQYISGEFRNKS